MAAVTAQTANFFGDTPIALPKIKAPPKTAAQKAKEQAQLKTRQAAETRAKAARTATANEGYAIERRAMETYKLAREEWLRNDPGPEGVAWRARQKAIKSAGIDWGLIPMGAKVIGTGAAIIASGGAVAGALGATAATSAVAGAAALNTGVAAVQKGVSAANAAGKLAKGDIAGAASGLAGSGIKLSNYLPGAGKVVGDMNIKLPKVKVQAPSASELAKKATAAAKQSATSAVKSAAASAKKTATASIKSATKVVQSTVSTANKSAASGSD